MIRSTYLAEMIAIVAEQLHLLVSKFHQRTYRYTDMIDNKGLHGNVRDRICPSPLMQVGFLEFS